MLLDQMRMSSFTFLNFFFHQFLYFCAVHIYFVFKNTPETSLNMLTHCKIWNFSVKYGFHYEIPRDSTCKKNNIEIDSLQRFMIFLNEFQNKITKHHEEFFFDFHIGDFAWLLDYHSNRNNQRWPGQSPQN